MKNSIFFIVALSLGVLLLMNCKKIIPPETIKPRLLITLKNDSGKSVPGALVRLYKNAGDTGMTQISDSTGVVLFLDLEDSLYYWLAAKGCSTNRISQTTLNRRLVPNGILYGYSTLAQTGTLKIVNNSAEPYIVSDSTFKITLKKDSPYIAHRKVRKFLIHSEKVSTPGIGKDTLVQIKCADTITINIPY